MWSTQYGYLFIYDLSYESVYGLLDSMAIYSSMISKLRVYGLLLTVNKWVDQPPTQKKKKINEGHMCDHNHTVQRFITLQVRY